METKNEIRVFRGKYSFLSNFYPCKIEFGGLTFQSLEAAFQAAKCANHLDRVQFQTMSPVEAKKAGRKVKMIIDWERLKLAIMRELIRSKFENNPDLMEKLLATGDSLLVEDNTWHDNFYGNCTCVNCQTIPGQNQLGLFLMELRDIKRGIRLGASQASYKKGGTYEKHH